MMKQFPFRMEYCLLSDSSSKELVDVYQFFTDPDNRVVALCWFIHGNQWGVVDVDMLKPLQDKTLLTE